MLIRAARATRIGDVTWNGSTYPQFALTDPQTFTVRPPEAPQLPIHDDLGTSRIVMVNSVWLDDRLVSEVTGLSGPVFFATVVNLAPGVYGPAVKAVATLDEQHQYRMLGSCAGQWELALEVAAGRLGRPRDIHYLQDLAGSDPALLELATKISH